MASTAETCAAIERALTNLALTDDVKLERVLGVLVPKAIEMLETTDAVVVREVLKLLHHINKRLDPATGCALPVDALVTLYTTHTSAMVRNFALVYVEKGFGRADGATRERAIGRALRGLSTRSAEHVDVLVRLAFDALGTLKRDDSRRDVEFLVRDEDRKVFLSRALRFLCYAPNASGTSARATDNPLETRLRAMADAAMGVDGAPARELRAAVVGAAAAAAQGGQEAPALTAPPMLSPNAVERILGKGKPKPSAEALAKRKLALLEFIATAEIRERAKDVEMSTDKDDDKETGVTESPARDEDSVRFLVSGSEMLTHCIVASCDSDHEVARRGEELLKRRCTWETNRPIVNLDDADVASRLFRLFLGSSLDVPVESRVLPASAAVKLKIINLLTRSIAAADMFPKNIEVVKMCLYGEGTTTRLKACGMEFTVWILTHATNAELAAFAPSLMAGMIEILDSRLDGSVEGERGATFAQESLRGFCYQALSQLVERDRSSANKDVLLAERIFSALDTESDGVKPYVQEAARVLIKAYRESPSTYVQTRMEELILSAVVDKDNRTKRLVGAQWANEMFPFSHIPSRYAAIVVSGDSKHEMQVLGRAGLRPSTTRETIASATLSIEPWEGCDRDVEPKTWANEDALFDDLAVEHYRYMEYLAFCRGKTPKVLEEYPSASSALRDLATRLPGLSVNPALHAPLFLPESAMSAALEFTNACIACDVAKSRILTSEDVTLYLNFLNRCLVKSAGPTLAAEALKSFIHLIERTPELLQDKTTSDAILIRLRHFVAHTDIETRRRAAKLCGILVPSLAADARVPFLDEFLASCQTQDRGVRLELQDGALCASGYIVASGVIPDADAVRALKILIEMASKVGRGASAEATLAAVAAEAIGHASLRKLLPSVVVGDALSALCEVMKNTDPNVSKLAARAAGHIMLNDARESTTSVLLPSVLSMCEVKNDDAQFAIGEAIACAWGGANVNADKVLTTSFTTLNAEVKARAAEDAEASTSMDVDEVKSRVANYTADVDPRRHVHNAVVDAIFNQYIYSSRVEKRCAACVWLLSLVMHTDNHPRMLSMLQEAQEAFGSLLGDSNELTQELASRAMSLLYEMGDEVQQKELLASLIGTLNGEAPKKRHIKLDDNAKVFEEGTIAINDKALRGDSDKNSLTTYQELCSIVTDIGQPDLIYKFMDLANHQAAMNSSRGAAFGFASIAKRAGDALTPHLEKLVPKLYRMMHDPNPKMQEAVKGIWTSLIDSPKATIDAHFGAILDELFTEAGSRLWRSRQSSASALGEILSGRSFGDIEPYLERVWDVCLRLIDDIKETVRVAGEGLCRSVRSLTLRLCDAHHSGPSEVKRTIEIVLPILLERGLMSTVKEVQALSMDVIMKLVKFADVDAIRTHIPDIVKTLLESLSSMEDSRLNYIEQHAASFGQEASDKLEHMRVRAAKSSPMGETLDLLMAHIDEEVMTEIVGTMSSVLRTGVGLNTRAGAGRFLQRLCMRRGRLVRAHAGKLFSMLLSSASTEASALVRSNFVAAIAAIARYATEPRVNALALEIVRLAQSEAEKERAVAAQLALELSRSAPDALRPQATLILPLAFVGAYDTEAAGSKKWNEVWDENAGGVTNTLRIYFDEIRDITTKYLMAKQWQRKRQAAEVFSAIASKAPDVMSTKANEIMGMLIAELPGRIWEGKTSLFTAVAKVMESSAKDINVAMGVVTVIDALLAECARTKSDYRKAALEALDATLVAVSAIDGVDDDIIVSKIVSCVDAVLLAKAPDVDDIDSGVGVAGSAERIEAAKFETELRMKATGASAVAAMAVLATCMNRVKTIDALRAHAPKCAALCATSLDPELSRDRRRQALKACVGLMRTVSSECAATFDVKTLLSMVVLASEDTQSSALRLDAVDAIRAIANDPNFKITSETKLREMTNDKNPEVMRAALRALDGPSPMA